MRTSRSAAEERRTNSNIIHVVVVESHHHVLEHIHHVLRRKKSSRRSLSRQQQQQSSMMEPWSMIHFDAHPDLACPNPSIPAIACFQPRHEYLSLLLPNSKTSSLNNISSTAATAAALSSSSSSAASTIPNSTTNENYDGIVSTADSSSAVVQQQEQVQRKNLYEMLDSTTSGIAEWILPLVLATNLCEIHWIRPFGQNVPGQFPLGQHEYHIGAWWNNNAKNHQNQQQQLSSQQCPKQRESSIITMESSSSLSFLDLPSTAVVKCDWDCLYYRDEELDSSYAPRNELVLAQPLNLIVDEIDTTTFSSKQQQPTRQQQQQQSQPWTLDICLDYFVCLNPFIIDIQAMDPVFSKALTLLVCYAKCYHHQQEQEQNNNNNNREMLLEFRKCFIHLLQSALMIDLRTVTASAAAVETTATTKAASPLCTDCCASSSSVDKTKKMLMAPMLIFYKDSCGAENLGFSLMEALWSKSNDFEKQTKLVSLAIEALPHLTMPHDATISSSKKRRLDEESDDRHSSSTPDESTRPLQQQETTRIAQMVQYVREYQQQQQQARTNDDEKSSSNDEPFLVTIARSSQDGFTPPCLVESLQDGVLEAVHDLYCNCGGKPKTPAATTTTATRLPFSFSNSSDCINGSPPTTLPTGDDSKTSQSDLSSSFGNCDRNCRIQILFDYGCWEGSTLDL